MMHSRLLPTAAAALAVIATTAMASAGPTPIDLGTVRSVAPVRHPATALVARHPIAVISRRPNTTPVQVTRRPVIGRRVNSDVSDDVLLARINRIDRENCALVMRERPSFAPGILAGIIEQRQAECMRPHFNPAPFNPGFRRDADDHRVSTVRFDDRRDDRQINRLRFDGDDRRISTARFDDRRDDHQISRLRNDDRRDDHQIARFDDRRDDRQISRLRFDGDDRHATAARFAPSRTFAADRRFAARRDNRPMGRPRP